MTSLVPITLFGWVPLTVLLFLQIKPHRAVLCSVIGGWLFLPMAGYNLPGLPEYSKITAISIGLLLGHLITRQRQSTPFKWKICDAPMITWCFLCPTATSLSNQLGIYDGVSGIFGQTMTYGVPYYMGRIYFNNTRALKDLCFGVIIGGMIYLPLCLYEIRMAPRLHREIYGFHQHAFHQHIRYGGYRPMVFMQHGLMVSLWMALSTTTTFWYWRNNEEKHLKGIPFSVIFVALAVTTVLCKSANGWAVLTFGISSCMLYRNFNAIRPFQILLLGVPLYIISRTSVFISAQEITSVASILFDDERITSLATRLIQEDLINVEALKRPFLGWGTFGRGMPIDPVTGERINRARDALWLITFQTYGFTGLFSLYSSLLLGPWFILNNSKRLNKSDSNYFLTLALSLSLVVILYSIDSLVNGMFSPLYITISGALISLYMALYKDEQTVDSPSLCKS
ncbi:O-antigen ligase domain-containing protein [Thermodesulfobacteriota bacterium]